MKVKPLLLLTILCVCHLGAQASTMDQLQSLWNPKGLGAAVPETNNEIPASAPGTVISGPSRQPVWFRLSNGQKANLAEWKVVLFMQGSCPYCHKFDPVLKSLSERVGFGVMAYTIDGHGDEAYPEALPVPADVMRTFFPNLPVATPTTFLVNVNTLEALPLLQGATDEQGFMARLDTVLQMRQGGRAL
ncbi:type-F conjugative transfer system pilin assembly thiol-disulfide isomerase TrbB [Serratia marcescens]|nr:type-F conjugative transfer system pilin assembly thiol-disulfide isomerase TrbB [Serratia marcescens]